MNIAVLIGIIAVFIGVSAEGRLSDVAKNQSNEELVQSSRSAIIETGFSPSYFDQHFSLVEAFDKPGDTRIVWKFSLRGYQVLVNDAIGYYTAESRKKVLVHSVKTTLASTKDITSTISRRRAEALMRACLGRYANEAIVLMRLSPAEKTSLYMTAHAIGTHGSTKAKKDQEAETESGINTQIDQPEKEEIQKRPRILGYVNLETGKCSKATAVIVP